MVSSDEYYQMIDISSEYGPLFFICYCIVNENTGVVSIKMNTAE